MFESIKEQGNWNSVTCSPQCGQHGADPVSKERKPEIKYKQIGWWVIKLMAILASYMYVILYSGYIV
jgi:hypothetical protein